MVMYPVRFQVCELSEGLDNLLEGTVIGLDSTGTVLSSLGVAPQRGGPQSSRSLLSPPLIVQIQGI
jgi:hypothetical protein